MSYRSLPTCTLALLTLFTPAAGAGVCRAAPPRMPEYGKEKPPPPRTRAEVQAVLAGAPNPPLKTRPLHVVLVAGKKDHGLGAHDYPAWQKVWTGLLATDADTRVTTAWEWPKPEEFRTADVMVFYQHG